MKTILLFLVNLAGLFSGFISFVVKIATALLSPAKYDPGLNIVRMIGEAGAQIFGVKYIFDKRPCSATGGIA
jgi:hypothetical protein